jgi:hypothetical protein
MCSESASPPPTRDCRPAGTLTQYPFSAISPAQTRPPHRQGQLAPDLRMAESDHFLMAILPAHILVRRVPCVQSESSPSCLTSPSHSCRSSFLRPLMMNTTLLGSSQMASMASSVSGHGVASWAPIEQLPVRRARHWGAYEFQLITPGHHVFWYTADRFRCDHGRSAF